jgi:hypothetical protein
MNMDDFIAQLSKLSTPMLVVLLLVFTTILIANIWYYRTLQRTMGVVSPSLRPCPPALIWLALLPYVGILWYMAYIIMLSLGLRKELAKRTLHGSGGLGISVAMVVLFLACMVPALRLYAILPTMAMWIVHWQRMAMHHKLLAEPVYMLVD